MNIPDPQYVVEAIWARSTGSRVWLPRYEDGFWREGAGYLPDFGLQVIAKESKGYGPKDTYFTPLRYNGAMRRKAFVGEPGVIFADIDYYTGLPPDFMWPSVTIDTSPGHKHLYWFLDTPHDPQEWEPYAKGTTLAIDGADPGGWDLTQVLRVPGAFNTKYDPYWTVRTSYFNPNHVYKIEDFPKATVRQIESRVPVPYFDKQLRNRLIETGAFSLSARYWLNVSKDEYKKLGRVDRSRLLWELEKGLYESGFSSEEIFILLVPTPFNKHKGNDEKLWREVLKAAIT